jgi:tetratricopeptide (TPR) repeat protein
LLFNFFKKGYTHYQERGDNLFQEGRYAEARHEYEEAISLLKPDTAAEVRVYLGDQIRSAGNQLATMNMQEAVHSLQSGNLVKAIEHAELALEQAEDDTIRGNARDFIEKVELPVSHEAPQSHGHSCSSCSGDHHATAATSEISTDFLPLMERFELLIQPLPGDLSDRYRQMGERFAYAYIAVHDERVEEGYSIFTELSREQKSDILEYEIAIIDFQAQRLFDCETHLKAALSINADSPLCHLAMVQLMIETKRLPEAANILQHMIISGHLADHAVIMLGDVLLMMGDVDAALERYIEALNLPSVAKTAAQKAIPVLDNLGRTADSQALAKRYLKGCC